METKAFSTYEEMKAAEAAAIEGLSGKARKEAKSAFYNANKPAIRAIFDAKAKADWLIKREAAKAARAKAEAERAAKAKPKALCYSVILFDAPWLSQADQDTIEEAAAEVIEKRFTVEVAMLAYGDYMTMIREGIARAENGQALWNLIENEAWAAGLEALGVETLGEAHLEFDFWFEGEAPIQWL